MLMYCKILNAEIKRFDLNAQAIGKCPGWHRGTTHHISPALTYEGQLWEMTEGDNMSEQPKRV